MNVDGKYWIDKNVFVKKEAIFGLEHHRLVYPLKKDDGSINWFNLCTGGSYWNLIKVAIFVSLMVALVLVYKHDMSSCVAINDKLAAKCMEIDFGEATGGMAGYDVSVWLNQTKGVEDGLG